MKYKAKMAKGGKISIPSACRKYLKLQSGDEIVFNLEEGRVILLPVKSLLEKARKIVTQYQASNKSLVDMLIEERRAEAKNE
ncbi:MAG: AbrB/MazE/SpoVT family DNA-binding domain-containing protein [Rickettsiaceae bacterium]|nr:AbrB/MazE/SpoVT family DNA-binding domain-containing protein [Rickettsiaceae bacterium]